MKERLERYFEFEQLGTNWKTEILAGFTTFLTMAYIIFVNPSILAEAGMPFTAVVAATCISAAFGSFMMGFYARYPIALRPAWASMPTSPTPWCGARVFPGKLRSARFFSRAFCSSC